MLRNRVTCICVYEYPFYMTFYVLTPLCASGTQYAIAQRFKPPWCLEMGFSEKQTYSDVSDSSVEFLTLIGKL